MDISSANLIDKLTHACTCVSMYVCVYRELNNTGVRGTDPYHLTTARLTDIIKVDSHIVGMLCVLHIRLSRKDLAINFSIFHIVWLDTFLTALIYTVFLQ